MVQIRRAGSWAYYRLNPELLGALSDELEALRVLAGRASGAKAPKRRRS
jgi:hypothetical protein